MSNKVPIQPSSFSSDDSIPDLSQLSLEDVVSKFKDTERKRTSRMEPDSESEVSWGIRCAPVELLSSLKVVSVRLGVSRSVLTRCMSRHMIDWYVNSLGMDSLKGEYDTIYSKIKMRGYSTLRIQAENPAKFEFSTPLERSNTSLSTIQWVVSKLQDIREILGMTSTDVLLSGMMWSLTMLDNRDWDRRNIECRFVPETLNMGVLVNDRLADVRALFAKYQYREGVDYNNMVYGGA